MSPKSREFIVQQNKLIHVKESVNQVFQLQSTKMVTVSEKIVNLNKTENFFDVENSVKPNEILQKHQAAKKKIVKHKEVKG